MDLQDTSTAFASIVSLIAEYINQRRAGSALSYNEFVTWLADNRHEELVKLIGQNLTTITSIKTILAHNQTTLERIDRNVALIADRLQGLPELTERDAARELMQEIE